MKQKLLLPILLLSSVALSANESSFGTVQITASKVNENLSDAAKTVEIKDNQKLKDEEIKDISHLTSKISNTNISGIGNRTDTTVTIRGISNYVSFESSASMYVDDAPIPYKYGYGGIDFHNIEKIEVFKGPHGTQFGKNAESGVLNLYTKEPSKTLENSVQVEMGNYNKKGIRLSSSGPVDESLLYTISGYQNSRDGFTENSAYGNTLSDRESSGANVKIKYKDKSPFTTTFSYNRSNVNDGGTTFRTNTVDTPFTNYEPHDSFITLDNELASLKLVYEKDLLKVTNVLTYGKQNIKNSSYINPGLELILDWDIDIEEVTEEIRMNYYLGNTEILFGGFYSDRYKFDYNEVNTIKANGASQSWDNKLPDENRALFSEIKHYFHNSYNIGLGLRYQETIRGIDRKYSSFTKETSSNNQEEKWEHTLPMISVGKSIDANSNAYIRYAKGYRPGGFTMRVSALNLKPYDPESTNSYEIGYKRAENNYILTSAIFHNTIKNLRVNAFNDDLSSSLDIADEAVSYGLELDLNMQVDDKLSFNYSLGLIEGEYKDFTANGADFSGKTIIDMPEMTTSLSAKYLLDKGLYIVGNVNHIGKKYYDKDNSRYAPSATLADLKVGLKDNEFRVELYSTNIFDKKYVDFIIPTPNHTHYHFGAPREIGATFAMDF